MISKLAILFFILICNSSFSQPPGWVSSPDGAYLSYNEFNDGRPSFSVDSVKNNMMKNQYGNIIIVPAKRFSGTWGIVLKNNLYIRRTSNMRSSDLPNAVIPLPGIVFTISKLDVAFVRIIKYGSICLNAENDMIKLPSIQNYEASISNFKYLIKDDKALTAIFRKEKNKKISVYRYIDLYNTKHPIAD